MSVRRTVILLLPVWFLFALVAASLWAVPDPSAHAASEIPENFYLRTQLIDDVLGPIENARRLPDTMKREPGYNVNVQFFVEEQNDSIYFCFYHGDDVEFNAAVAGSYIIKRSRLDGQLEQIKIFYKSEPGSFVRIFPDREGLSRIDVYLRDRKLQSDVKLHLPLERIARMPFTDLVRRTVAYIDWEFYIPTGEFRPPELTTVDDLYQQVKPYLEQLRDAEDGAINAEGEFVQIEDGSLQSGEGGLNCSGFAKWVVDSLLYPKTDQLLSIDALKRPHPDYRGNRWSRKVEDVEDPYFGLDWTRNLAIEAHRALDLLPVDANPEFADVNFLRYHEYEEDVGYSVATIETVMYELAKENPGHIYLGSVNALVHNEYELRKHLHVAVFFPWLDAEGRLVLKILETNEETSAADFMRRYEGEYIHFVSIPQLGVFKPANMRLEPVLKR
ncbi:MAG: hypothetical protein ACOC2P_00215 [Spirochaetota bacterium]